VKVTVIKARQLSPVSQEDLRRRVVSPDRPASRLLFAGDYPRKDRPLPRFLDDGTAANLLATAAPTPTCSPAW
jgi:hypothetical protein